MARFLCVVPGLVVLACASATPSSPPAESGAAAGQAGETCLLGQYRVIVQQRMVQDDGETSLLEDQSIGRVPVLFAAQRRALRGGSQGQLPNAPQSLLLLRGAQVTEELSDLEYVPRPDGAKPTQTRTTSKPYTFFLADAAWDCAAVATELAALQQGEVGASACVPEALRSRCTPVDLMQR